MVPSSAASWLEISANALRNNLNIFRQISNGKFSIGIVLKGNAYGHGLDQVFPIVHSLVDCIYVITAQDAFQMRRLESNFSLLPRRIVVIGALSGEDIVECARQKIEMAMGDLTWQEVVTALRSSRLRATVHVHLDTGLSREGFSPEALKDQLKFIKSVPDAIEVAGAMSHFANTEDVTEQKYALLQIACFKRGVEQIKTELSLTKFDEHFAASAATLTLPEAHFTSVRIGISLYGFWPSTETRISANSILSELPALQPVLSWKCKSQMIKFIKKGTFVGYGCTYRTERDSWIATFPVGYFDGYPRLVSGKAYVLVQGRRCPVIGRVMMNHIVVDVTHVMDSMHNDSANTNSAPLSLTATLLGADGDEEVISAETLAAWAGTIHYEIVTRLGSHLKRISVA